MPCYRCGARQVDPEQGKPSPWKRGVRREHQVLICPDCAADAAAELDRCADCGGTHLIRRLDQVECLSCGLARDADPTRETESSPTPATAPPSSASVSEPPLPGTPAAPDAPRAVLADEVARALDRVLGRD
jgi:ribosomal protein L32